MCLRHLELRYMVHILVVHEHGPQELVHHQPPVRQLPAQQVDEEGVARGHLCAPADQSI